VESSAGYGNFLAGRNNETTEMLRQSPLRFCAGVPEHLGTPKVEKKYSQLNLGGAGVSAGPLKAIYSVSATPKEAATKNKERPSTVSLAGWHSESFYGSENHPNF
jgi:hypothetical protein